MSAWSAWNVTGQLNSEIIRLLSQIQHDVYQMETNKVTKGGDNVTGNSSVPLVIGTNTDNPLQFETNNTPRMTIENTGNVSVAQQIEISGTQATPGLCSSVNNDTGIFFPTDATVQIVANDAVMAEVTPTEMTVSSARVDFGDSGPYIQHAGSKFTMEAMNHNIELTMQGQYGIELSKSGTTTTAALIAPTNGQFVMNSAAPDLRVQVQATEVMRSSTSEITASKQVKLPKTILTSRGTSSSPAVTFADKPDTGVYLSADGLLTVCQDGSDVFRCFSTGVDMKTDTMFFDTVANPSVPQICWDHQGARDTGFYSPQDGIIRARNNAQETLNLSDSVLAHMKAHTGNNREITREFPMFGSWTENVTAMLVERDIGDPNRTFAVTMFLMHYRVGNIVTTRSMLTWNITQTTDGIYVVLPLHFTKHTTGTSFYTVSGKSYNTYPACGTLRVLNNEPTNIVNNVVAEGAMITQWNGSVLEAVGSAWHKSSFAQGAFPVNNIYYIVVDVTYHINSL